LIIPESFSIKETKIGASLFTKISIRNGTKIASENGYTQSNLANSPKMRIEVGNDLFLHYNDIPHYLDYVNHSCNPNMIYDISKKAFFAIRDISKDEELTYDYDTTETDMISTNESFFCKCDSSNCKIEIRGSTNNKRYL